MPQTKLIIFSAVALILIIATTTLTLPKSHPPLAFRLVASPTQIAVGETARLTIYLEGEEIQKTTAYLIQLNYDENKLQIISAEEGGFLPHGLVLKCDTSKARFALSQDPTLKSSLPQSNLPLLVVDFKAKAATDLTQVSTASDSEVYLSQKGAFYPKGHFEKP
jgi:hypothetical protein